MPEPRLAFKAGRAFRREGTNFVDPSPTKGAVILQSGDDDLLHFQWKNRSTNEIEEDLILFPADASFDRVDVEQSPNGRVYVLKFSSSDQRHFFWMQDANVSQDAEFVMNVNRLLGDPSVELVWGLEHLVASIVTGQWLPDQSQRSEILLSDVLTPANLTPLFKSHPELVPSLFPHLPPDLPSPPSAEVLEQIIASPQFRAAVRNLDQAFRTGLLGGLVRGLGLPEEAGRSVQAFLTAVQAQANDSEEAESMETD